MERHPKSGCLKQGQTNARWSPWNMGMHHKEKLLAVHKQQACIEESQGAFSCPDAQTNKEELQGADHGL